MKILGWIIGILLVVYLGMFLYGQKEYEVEYGVTFNQYHAESLGLDWKEVYLNTLKDLKPKHIRIAAMWNEVERSKGKYNFSKVDWMMNKAKKYDTKVTLVIGQKAPRWPECHVPDWLKDYDKEAAKDHLMSYIKTTVNRYKDHSALDIWQVENEPFIRFEFGDCKGYREDLVDEEVNLVNELDSKHDILITDSGELGLWYKASQIGDILGTTVYRIVRTDSGATFSWRFLPAGYYKLKARLLGKNYQQFFVSELQAEPWFNDDNPLTTSIKKQEETMSPNRLKSHINYAKRIGASRVYLWGVEWWYYMKTERGVHEYWNIIDNKIN